MHTATLRLLSLACLTAAAGTTACASVTFRPGVQAIGEYKNTRPRRPTTQRR
jgi:hypothetical protein